MIQCTAVLEVIRNNDVVRKCSVELLILIAEAAHAAQGLKDPCIFMRTHVMEQCFPPP